MCHNVQGTTGFTVLFEAAQVVQFLTITALKDVAIQKNTTVNVFILLNVLR